MDLWTFVRHLTNIGQSPLPTKANPGNSHQSSLRWSRAGSGQTLGQPSQLSSEHKFVTVLCTFDRRPPRLDFRSTSLLYFKKLGLWTFFCGMSNLAEENTAMTNKSRSSLSPLGRSCAVTTCKGLWEKSNRLAEKFTIKAAHSIMSHFTQCNSCSPVVL